MSGKAEKTFKIRERASVQKAARNKTNLWKNQRSNAAAQNLRI